MEMPNILSWVTDKQVPTVDPSDLKALHKFQADLAASNPLPPGQMRAVSHEVVQQLLTPGADIGIVGYRLGWVQMLQKWHEYRPVFPWINNDRVDDAVFEALAVLPMTGIPSEGLPGLPFDINELARLISMRRGPMNPTGFIPAVDPDELKSAWTFQQKVRGLKGELTKPDDLALADELVARSLKPETDQNVSIRNALLIQMVELSQMDLGELTAIGLAGMKELPGLDNGKPSDAMLKAIARIKMPMNANTFPPFDMEEFTRLIEEERGHHGLEL